MIFPEHVSARLNLCSGVVRIRHSRPRFITLRSMCPGSCSDGPSPHEHSCQFLIYMFFPTHPREPMYRKLCVCVGNSDVAN